MKAGKVRLVIVIAVAAIAVAGFAAWYLQASERELAVTRCMEGGDGDMFTSREGCEARYPEGGGKR